MPLNRNIGVLVLGALIFNCTVGGGIFRLPGSVYAVAGTASPLAVLLCAIATGFIALQFAESGSRVFQTGGPHAYVAAAFGPYWGALNGFLVWAMSSLCFSAVASAYGDLVQALFPAISGVFNHTVILLVTFACIVMVQLRGVELGGRVLVTLTLLKTLPLVALVVFGLRYVNLETLIQPSDVKFEGISRGSLILFFAFFGVETALIPGGEIRQPNKTVPRAIVLSLVGISFLYLCLLAVLQSVLGTDLGGASMQAPLADAAARLGGPGARVGMLIAGILSMLGYQFAMMLALPRSLYRIAEDGLISERFMQLDPRYKVPSFAILFQGALLFGIAATQSFESLMVLANLSALVLYVFTALATYRLRLLKTSLGPDSPPLNLGGGLGSTLATLLVLGVVLFSATLQEWFAMTLIVAIGSSLYFLRRKNPRKKTNSVDETLTQISGVTPVS